jgi:hypothetical protein
MRKLELGLVVFGVLLAGCSGGTDSPMTKSEENALKNPPKTISKEAAEGMSHMGELVKKQQEANAAAGVDSRGVPLSKSHEAGAGAPLTPPTGGN